MSEKLVITQWEYYYLDSYGEDTDKVFNELDGFGLAGWELIAVTPLNGGTRYILKKPVS